MLVFRNRTTFEVTQNAKVFLNLDASISRSEVSDLPNRQESLEHARRQIEDKDKELAKLRTELAQANRGVHLPGSSSESPLKFFLVGRSKSGTSWLMRLLNSHPEILCRGEGKFFGKDSPKSLHDALARSELLQIWLNRNPWTWQDQDPDLQDIIRVIVEYLMEDKLRKSGKKVVGDKTPLESLEIMEEIANICPGSKAVHIIRDGRDVSVSTVHHRWNNATDKGGPFKLTAERESKREAYRSNPDTFGPGGQSIFGDGEVAELARRWKTAVGRAIQDGPKFLNGNYHQLHYEDLLMKPLEETRRVLEFLSVDSSEETIWKCVDATSFERMSGGRSTGDEDSTSFYRKGVSGDWKGIFTKEDREVFKEEAGDLLIQLGYEKDNDW